jgi:hypothetical protein
MAANTSISLVNLDFDTLKASLKTYLKNQSLFQDYDFDGSNMSVLLDILSYNSYLNTFYLNMVASEMFIDSAQLRNSIISIAKGLNYTPRSAKSPKALLNLTFAQSGLQSFEIPEFTKFTGKNSNGSFTFTTNETLTLYPSNGVFSAANVAIYEGIIIQDTFVYDTSVEFQRFIFSNENIDTDSIITYVTEDISNTALYLKATNLYGLKANSQVYFVQATENTKYELVFGDGIFGRKLKDGAIITVSYRVTSGNNANKCTSFILDDNLGAYNNYGSAIIPSITTVSSSYGGAEAESIEEIRYRAPRNFQTQERAITTDDFKNLVLQNYQDIKTVHVYGGETISGTPTFGKVYIAPATFTGEFLSDAEKSDVESYLSDKCTLGITPIVVNPDYLYIMPEVVAKYNANQTTASPTDISTSIKTSIINFNQEQLNDFNKEFRFSRFETAINAADTSISSNESKITLKKSVNIVENTSVFISVNFRNPISPGSLFSSDFISNGRRYVYTDYNPNANTFQVKQTDGDLTVINQSNLIYLKDITTPGIETFQSAGTIDYNNGLISLNQIKIFQAVNSLISFYCRPLYFDVSSSKNDVITIDISNLDITVKSL